MGDCGAVDVWHGGHGGKLAVWAISSAFPDRVSADDFAVFDDVLDVAVAAFRQRGGDVCADFRVGIGDGVFGIELNHARVALRLGRDRCGKRNLFGHFQCGDWRRRIARRRGHETMGFAEYRLGWRGVGDVGFVDFCVCHAQIWRKSAPI